MHYVMLNGCGRKPGWQDGVTVTPGNRGEEPVMQVMIRCKVKPDEVARNLESLHAVYEELESVRPDGLRYATFQLEDEVTFVAFVEMENSPAVLRRLEAFQRYRATLDERCDEPPVMAVLHEVGSYPLH
jgi:quinol monooxygenase YgiN